MRARNNLARLPRGGQSRPLTCGASPPSNAGSPDEFALASLGQFRELVLSELRRTVLIRTLGGSLLPLRFSVASTTPAPNPADCSSRHAAARSPGRVTEQTSAACAPAAGPTTCCLPPRLLLGITHSLRLSCHVTSSVKAFPTFS